MGQQAVVTGRQLRQALESLGIRAAQAVVVHGSLRNFGRVEGGADAIVEAVVSAVGPEGLVTMPVYSSSLDEHDDLLRVPLPAAKVSTGAIPAAFARRPDAIKADHPLYAYAYWGPEAGQLARDCQRLLAPYGKDQPLCCLYPRRGYIVQLGVDDNTNTSIHVAEELADPAYLADKKSVSRITVDEFFALPRLRRREILKRHQTGPKRHFTRCTPLIQRASLRRSATVGGAIVAVTDFVGLCELLVGELQKNPSLML